MVEVLRVLFSMIERHSATHWYLDGCDLRKQ
jgi:hypothetical protein